MFAGHVQAYQAISAQMSAFHAQFVQALNGAGGAYAAAEAANASPLQALQDTVLGAINGPPAGNPGNGGLDRVSGLLFGSLGLG